MGKLRNYLELIQEMSIAGYGDWEPSNEMVGTMSAHIIRTKWKELDTIKTKLGDVYKVHKLKDSYVIGEYKNTSVENEEIFEVYLRINLTEHKSTAIDLDIHRRLMNVDGVKVNDDKQGIGLATAMYNYLVKQESLVILSDETQYFGARKLWSRLSKSLDLIVDIVDISKGLYLEKDVKIHHGLEDYEFDTRVWDYTPIKKDIRLILKEIK